MRPALRVCAKAYTKSPIWTNYHRCAAISRSLHSGHRASDQKHIFEGYTADLLDAPLLEAIPGAKPKAEITVNKDEPALSEEEERIAKARVVFGSRPGQWNVDRREEIERQSKIIAGVSVPPKPEEPDNCCMSGCVNCVWDLFRDDIEEWAAKSAEARKKLQEQRSKGQAMGMMSKEAGMPDHVAMSMDDDGGGSDSGWAAVADGASAAQGEDDLFAGIPVEIREFMKTEKKLKEKHKKEKA